MTDETLSTLNSAVKELQDKIRSIQKEAEAKGKDAFMNDFQAFFDKYPFLGSIAWNAYTPYFNDGDECVFGSHHTDAGLNSVKDIEDETDNGAWENGSDWYTKSNEELGRSETNPDYDPNERLKPYRDQDHKKTQPTIYKYYPNENVSAEYVQAEDEIRTYLAQFDDEIMKAIFGDHVTVSVTKDGIETEDCEHD